MIGENMNEINERQQSREVITDAKENKSPLIRNEKKKLSKPN